jgi:hypothetical protein
MDINIFIIAMILIPLITIFIIYLVGSQDKEQEFHDEDQDQIKEDLLVQLKEKNIKAHKTYNITHSYNINKQVIFDFLNKKIAILDVITTTIKYVDFNEIIACELIEDNATIMQGGFGRAVVGGVLAGGVGAIVGASLRDSTNVVNNLSIRIVTSDISDALVMITLIQSVVKRSDLEYEELMNTAQDIYSTVISIIESNKKDIRDMTDSIGSKSVAVRIRELAKLKEEGLLTEEEFNKKKKELLNLT